jgi:hypothetical protein
MSILALAIKGLKRVQQQNQKPKAKGTTVNHNKSGFSEVSSQPVISSKPI